MKPIRRTCHAPFVIVKDCGWARGIQVRSPRADAARSFTGAAATPSLDMIGVAAVTGTYVAPEGGWLPGIGSYLFTTVVFGALLLNLWEETGWQGMVQRHFMGRHGLVKGSLLTAVPFAIVHIPCRSVAPRACARRWSTSGCCSSWPPAARYLVGRTDYSTGGSLLAVGVLHASWNASGQLSVIDGDPQHVVGLVLVAIVALIVDVVRARSNSGVLSDHRDRYPASTAAAS